MYLLNLLWIHLYLRKISIRGTQTLGPTEKVLTIFFILSLLKEHLSLLRRGPDLL